MGKVLMTLGGLAILVFGVTMMSSPETRWAAMAAAGLEGGTNTGVVELGVNDTAKEIERISTLSSPLYERGTLGEIAEAQFSCIRTSTAKSGEAKMATLRRLLMLEAMRAGVVSPMIAPRYARIGEIYSGGVAMHRFRMEEGLIHQDDMRLIQRMYDELADSRSQLYVGLKLYSGTRAASQFKSNWKKLGKGDTKKCRERAMMSFGPISS